MGVPARRLLIPAEPVGKYTHPTWWNIVEELMPNESYKLAFKLFVQDASALGSHDIVPIFHSWIQQKKVADHLVIDVADYDHVPNGPGTLLIALEANFAADREDGRAGLLYIRKQPIVGATTFAERLRAAIRPLLEAAERLEQEPALAGKVKFRTDELLFRIYDRLLAPNTPETLADVKGDLEALVVDLYGAKPEALEYHSSAHRLFEVRIKTPGKATLASILQRLPAPAMA